jgi:hypothetical protein
MGKIINLKESTFRRLFEYVGDEEALGRYDISGNEYIPDEEKDSVIDKKTHDTEFIVDLEPDEPEYIGQEINDPGPYADYKRYDYK